MSTSKLLIRLLFAACVAVATARGDLLFGQDSRARVAAGAAPTSATENDATPTKPVADESESTKTSTSPAGDASPAGSGSAFPAYAASRTGSSPEETGGGDSRASRENGTTFPGFRYWMAPEASIDHWPWGGGKYLPIEATTFKEWLSMTRRQRLLQDYVDGRLFPGVVSTLKLNARLSGDALEGDGFLTTVAYPINDAVADSDLEFTTPPMQSFDVATSYPEDGTDAFDNKLATYPDGLFYLPNADSRTRRFRWSQRGKPDASGNLCYEFNFQSVLHVELILETEETEVPTVTGGVVLPVLSGASGESVAASEPSSPGIRTWRVCFRGRSQARVTIVRESEEESPVDVRPVGFRQESSYRLSLSGVELSTRFDFERVPSHLTEATVVLEPPLSFTSLEWGSTPARPVSTKVAEDGSTRVRVRIPSNLVGDAAASLRVNAFCPIWFGERRLPTARVIGDGVDWRESLMRLAVSAPLKAASVEPVDAVQTRDASRTRTEGLNVTVFKLFKPEGSVRMTLRHSVVAPPFDSATDCYFVANEVSAKTTLFFNFDGVERNRVSVPLSRGWDVDSIQSTQAESIAWSRETDPSGRRTLWLSFKNPPIPNQPTRVTLAARYVAPLEERLPVDRLCPLELQDSLDGAHALSVRTDSSSQIRYTTRGGKPFVPAKTTPDFIFGESLLREATPLAPGGVRLWIGDQTVDAFASLENVRSNYSVDLSCSCVLEEDHLQESWKLHCAPSSGMRVDRIVFFVSLVAEEDNTVASGLEWFWSTSIDPERRYEAPRLSEEEAAALHAPENSAAYEIRLATSRSVPFDLNVFCSVPATRDVMAPLIFFPDFSGRSVEVVVESNSNNLFRTEGAAIVESTTPTDGSNDSWFLKKAFRYDPTTLFGTNAEIEPEEVDEEETDGEKTEQSGEEQPAPVARKQEAPVVPYLKLSIIERARSGSGNSEVLPLNSLCWFEDYDSYYQNDGVVHHCATFYLENRGRDSVRFGLTLPPRSGTSVDENADDYLEPDPWRDEVYDDVGIFGGSLEFAGEWEYIGHGEVFDSISAVWADGERAPWTLWKLPGGPGEPERYVVDVRLLAKRRYVRVEFDYCDSTGKRLSGSRRVRPIQIECDMPALSGVWNAWFPPQFQTRRTYFQQDETNVGFAGRLNSIVESLFFTHDRDELEDVAERVASRLGDEFALRLAISQARRVDSGEAVKPKPRQKSDEKNAAEGETSSEESSSSTSNTSSQKETDVEEVDALRIDVPRIDASTWGDVFGSPSLTANLFAPEFNENADDSSHDGESSFAVESAFGRLEGSSAPTTLLIDRYALVSVGVSPNLPLPSVEGSNPQERANLLLGSANLKLLLVSPRLALLTTGEVLTRQYGSEFISLCGPTICSPSSRRVARRIHDEILDPNLRRYVGPAAWRDFVESTNPWTTVGFDASDGSSVQGWTFASVPIGRASEGVYIVNRYVLIALEFFGLVGFVVFFWRRACVTPRFLIGTIGVCLAVLCPARYEAASLARGVLYGATCLFVFRSVRILLPTRRREDGESDFLSLIGSDSASENQKEPQRRRVSEGDESVSSDGRVDFARMSPEELHYIQSGTTELPHDRDGKTTMKTLLAILTSLLVVVGAAACFARVPDGPAPTAASSVEKSANPSSTPTTPSTAANQPVSSNPTPGATSGTSAPSSGVVETPGTSDAGETPKETFREPYRVFVPTDDARKPSGKYYWIDSSFYDVVRSDLRSKPHERSWRVVDALYQGSVNYNSFTKTTSVFSLKATYLVVTESSSVTISLPAVQIVSDGGARFDRQTVAASYSEDGSEIYFDVQAEPGAHTLELFLVPPQFFETTSRLAVPILPVASAKLDMDVSVDAPALDVPNAIGKIERSSQRFTAELGPVDQLVITKAETQASSEKTELEVEQFFLMRPRAAQTDVRAAFHCQTTGGKLQTLEINCDPAYVFSGYCKCDVGEIESVDSPTSTNSAMRITFKRPISGSFTVNVDFVARNFSGVGRAPIPRISTRDANVVKNWLALSPDPGVECVSQPGVSGLAAAFQSAWGKLDSKIVAAYDLDALEESTPIDVRLVHSAPETEETTTCVFSPAFTKVDFKVVLNSSSDLFRVLFNAPKPFVVDSLVVTDENGANVAPPEQILSEDGLCLEFEGALRGKHTIEIVGRTRRPINRDADFPLMSVSGALCRSRYARVYCSPNVDLKWKSFPGEWAIADRELFATLGDEPPEVCPVEVYSVGAIVPQSSSDEAAPAGDDLGQKAPSAGENAATAADETALVDQQGVESEQPLTPEVPVVAVHMNVPELSGVERIFLYPVDDPSSFDGAGKNWKATYQLRFQSLNGRIDRIYVAADDLYSLDPLLTTSFFTVEETTTPAGEKAWLFTPKRPVLPEDGEVELLFTASFKSDPSGVCLPRFRTLPSSLYEDFSGVARTAYLATLRGSVPILWSTRNMKKEDDPRLEYERKRGELVNVLSPGLRSMAMNGSAKKDGEDVGDDAPRDDVSATTFDPPFPAAVEQTKRVGAVSFERYACDKDASAWLSSQSDRMKVDLARYAFFVNERREIFGGAVFMIKPGSSDKCVVVAPAGYHVLEARVNGARRLVERAADELPESEYDSESDSDSQGLIDDETADGGGQEPENVDDPTPRPTRWIVELDGAPYVKRLEISFQASGKTSTKTLLFNELRRRSESFDVDFLRLESADVKRVLWVCAFEDFDSENRGARWTVTQHSLIDRDGVPQTDVVSHECVPVLANQAGGAMCRVSLEDAAALLSAYENDSAQLSGARGDDLERMRARWLSAWRKSVGSTTPYMTNSRNIASASFLQESSLRSIAVVNNGVFLPPEQVDANFPTPNWSAARISEIETAKNRVFSLPGMEEDSVHEEGSTPASSQNLWTLHTAVYSRVLLGSTDACVSRIEIDAKPKAFDFLASPYSTAIFLLMATVAILQLLDSRGVAKGLRSVVHVAFMFVWAVCFFLFGWALVALSGAFLLAVIPFIWSFLKRRRATALAVDAEREEIDPQETTIAGDQIDSDSSVKPGAPTQYLPHDRFADEPEGDVDD